MNPEPNFCFDCNEEVDERACCLLCLDHIELSEAARRAPNGRLVHLRCEESARRNGTAKGLWTGVHKLVEAGL